MADVGIVPLGFLVSGEYICGVARRASLTKQIKKDMKLPTTTVFAQLTS